MKTLEKLHLLQIKVCPEEKRAPTATAAPFCPDLACASAEMQFSIPSVYSSSSNRNRSRGFCAEALLCHPEHRTQAVMIAEEAANLRNGQRQGLIKAWC